MPRHGLPISSRHAPRLAALAAVAAVAAGAAWLALPVTMPAGHGAVTGAGPDPVAVAGQEPRPAATPPATETRADGRATAFADPRRRFRAGPVEGPTPGPATAAQARQPAAPAGAPTADSLEGYQWPLAHARLTLPFGPTFWGSRIVDGERFHDGVDLASFCGDRVLAAHDGVVLAAGRHFDRYMGWVGDLGPYFRRLDRQHLWFELPIVVVIDDGNGYRSMYAHFSKVVVKPGDVVRAGDLLGREGMTGHASGCHVHYGLYSPDETATFAIRPDVAKRMRLPRLEIARIDPLQVMPPRRGLNARAFPVPELSATP